ncbi:hypothetical protein P6P90_04785 [Ectobacillus antri]|uniref:Uncharacterized protein n=1 Tax=Ectobacillus antri TaxID=2486280 RepID=A0ABT6H4F8_9BACI|nr:hypothetical protein [Ectobacillus antri]MDG4655553.1 hypothetical protein [Ectobacillus antri]MDG5753311.1 hypothetical protein [Ectobacillus antri]
MENVVIYYQQKQNESTEKAIHYINTLIKKLENRFVIKGVYIDRFENRNEFVDLLQSPLSEIDYIYLEQEITDEFDKQMLNELSKAENFKIKYFHSI